MKHSKSKLLKSVVIRFKNRQKRLLISKNALNNFDFFLQKNIEGEFVIINSNVGFAVYYASEKNYSELIKQNILKHCNNSIEELAFLYDLNANSLKANFTQVFITFSKYPQLFLAYVKKFVSLRKRYNSSRIVMPQLSCFYKQALKELQHSGKLPFAKKIIALNSNFEKSYSSPLLISLAKKMTTQEHIN